MNEKDIVPEQEGGVQTNTESDAELTSIEQAKQFYTEVKQRLLNVNKWHAIAGKLTAEFQLTDAHGKAVQRTAQKGDYFKIDIPGPGPATGDGYDWVQIEAVDENEEGDEQSISIRVRPASNPNNDHQDVAHFFSDEATSCFIVKREGQKVIAGVYGRNEKPNTSAEKVVDKARNTAIASGAIGGFSKLQWKSLVNGLVKKE